MKVKLFWVGSPTGSGKKGLVTGKNRGENAAAFEAELNAWLDAHPGIKIAHIKQAACGGSWGPALWLVSVWYTE